MTTTIKTHPCKLEKLLTFEPKNGAQIVARDELNFVVKYPFLEEGYFIYHQDVFTVRDVLHLFYDVFDEMFENEEEAICEFEDLVYTGKLTYNETKSEVSLSMSSKQ
jgi:hypothetical protein